MAADPKIPTAKKSKPKASATKATGKRSTDAWPLHLGLFTLGPKLGKLKRTKHPIWQHAAAAALHGWEQHKHDAAAPLELSETDYRAALKAIEGQPPLQPHKAALSKHCKHTFTKAKG